jgi:hypothetical protein
MVRLLFQYTSRIVSGYAIVRGHADSDATVTVNENAAYRYGEYFFGSDEFDNSIAGCFVIGYDPCVALRERL